MPNPVEIVYQIAGAARRAIVDSNGALAVNPGALSSTVDFVSARAGDAITTNNVHNGSTAAAGTLVSYTAPAGKQAVTTFMSCVRTDSTAGYIGIRVKHTPSGGSAENITAEPLPGLQTLNGIPNCVTPAASPQGILCAAADKVEYAVATALAASTADAMIHVLEIATT